MKIVTAISHVDLPLAVLLYERLRKIKEMGGDSPTFALITSTWKDSWDVRPLYEKIADFMPAYFLITTDPEDDQWPEACNHLFIESAQWLHDQGNAEPWLFLEPDCAPLRPDWYTALKHEYAEAGQPYMGVRNTAIILNRATGQFFDDMEHMVGMGIYPADIMTRSQAIHFCGHWPWDCAMGPEVLPIMHNTKLIAHRWNTQKWRRNDEGLLVGELTPKAVSFEAKPPLPVGPECAVIHGCKDDSIFKLALFEKTA